MLAIERELFKAAGFAVAGAVLTFFGLMHGEQVGFAQSPILAIAYLCVAALMLWATKFSTVPVMKAASTHSGDMDAAPQTSY